MNIFVFILLINTAICVNGKRYDEYKERMLSADEELEELRRELVWLHRKIAELKRDTEKPLDTNSTNLTSYNYCSNIEGIRKIKLDGLEPFEVYCLENDYMVIFSHRDNTLSFDRNWANYSAGFGEPGGNFFVGLEKLHHLTKLQRFKIEVRVNRRHHPESYAVYNHFEVGSEEEGYELHIGDFNQQYSDADNAMSHYNGLKFATYDRDTPDKCASLFKGGWWHHEFCLNTVNPTGVFVEAVSILEFGSTSTYVPIEFLQMTLKPISS